MATIRADPIRNVSQRQYDLPIKEIGVPAEIDMMPIIKKILVIFEPSTLPGTISETPFTTEILEETAQAEMSYCYKQNSDNKRRQASGNTYVLSSNIKIICCFYQQISNY
jgi:hypothetical protein